MKFALFIAFVLLLNPLAQAKQDAPLIDYDKLDMSVSLKALRSGNQDPSGENTYYFKLTAIGVPILKEEVKKPLADRLKVDRDIGVFGELIIKSLKHWQPDKKPNAYFAQAVNGDLVREIASEVMRQFKVSEEGVSVLCRVEMFEKNKKFGFFGDDQKVGESLFPIIPESLPHGPQIENRELVIKDEFGTYVQLAVHFKTLETKKDGP